MRAKLVAATALFVAILLVVPVGLMYFTMSSTPQSLSNHPPIRIVGDRQFDRTRGVKSGSGTIADPYVIAGWDIDSFAAEDTCAGISLEDTTAYVVIKNVHIHGASQCDGVLMSNASNTRIEGTLLVRNRRGIAIQNSSNITVLENTIELSLQGIITSHSRSTLVQDNTVRRGDMEITVEDSSGISIIGNIVANSTADGITLLRSFNNTIESNEVMSSAFKGISMSNSSHDIVARNVVSGSGEQCFYMPYGHGNVLTDNFAEDCGWGAVDIIDASGIIASGNEVRRTLGIGFSLSDCSTSALIANKVSMTQIGIVVSSNSDFNLIAYNTITSSRTLGISLAGSPLGSPDYNLIQGNTVLGSGEFDLEDVSNGKENIWRSNIYITADVPTLP
jgi:parallel beta-helix repeat protein